MAKTIAETIAHNETLRVCCTNTPCRNNADIDLHALAARLGPDHGAMHADLIEHFYCRKCFEAGRYAFSLMFTVTPDYDRAMREKDYIGVPDKHRKPALRRVK